MPDTAAQRYALAAQHLLLRRSGAASPMGMDLPMNGQWYWRPAAQEWQTCCWLRHDYQQRRPPGVPPAYRQHSCTLDHVARLFGVDWSVLRVAVRLLDAGDPACVVEDVVAVMLVRQRLNPSGSLPTARQVRRITQAVRSVRDPTRSGPVTSS